MCGVPKLPKNGLSGSFDSGSRVPNDQPGIAQSAFWVDGQPTGQITEVKIQLPAEMAEPIGELWVNQGGYLVVSAFGAVTSRSCISLESR